MSSCPSFVAMPCAVLGISKYYLDNFSCRRHVKEVSQATKGHGGLWAWMKVCMCASPCSLLHFPDGVCSCLWAPPDQAGCSYWLHFFLWPLVSDLYMEIKYSYLAQDMTFKPSGNEGWQKTLRSVWKLLRRIKLLPKANISEISPNWLAVDMDMHPF